MSVEFHKPRHERVVTLDGWTVPLLEGGESEDGSRFWLTVDGRFGFDAPIEQAEQTVWFIAQVIASCWGYGAHPNPEYDGEMKGEGVRALRFARVPHPSLAPHRLSEITAVSEER